MKHWRITRYILTVVLSIALTLSFFWLNPSNKETVYAANNSVERILARARSHLNENEYDGSFHGIIDTYNSYTHAGLDYSESWCAEFVCVLFIEENMTDIMNITAGCTTMRSMFQKQGRWHDKGYVPVPGDLIFYDWDASGDCDHVGIVESCNGSTITVIEGNKGSSYTAPNGKKYDGVGRRTVSVNYSNIAGFATPNYDNVNAPGAQWTEYDDFYAYLILVKDWKHLESNSNNNVQLAAGGNNSASDSQLWRFVRLSNNNYAICNCKDGSVLDAYNLGTTNGTNVTTYAEWNGGMNQQWTIYRNGDAYSIKAAYCDLYFDCNGGLTDAGTNIQLWEYNGSQAQIFTIYFLAKKTDSLVNGDVYLIDFNNDDVWAHLENNDGNVQIASKNDSFDPKQVWKINKNSDDTYSFYSAYNDGTTMALTAMNGGTAAGTNVGVSEWSGSANQKWYIFERVGEYAPGYYIKAAYCEKMLDCNGGYSTGGTNINLWNPNNTPAQRFSIYYLSNDGTTYSRPSAPAAPTLSVPSSAVINESVHASWTASALKDSHWDSRVYRFQILNSNGTVVAEGDTTSCYVDFTGQETGTFTIRVYAINSKYPGTCVSSLSNSVKINISSTKTLTIRNQPLDYQGGVGTTAMFSVDADGTGLKYQWQTYTSGKWVNSSLPGATTKTLSVPVTVARDRYKFRCVVTDSNNKSVISNEATLYVAASALSITEQPENCSGSIGGTAKFKVTAKGVGLKYQWQTYSGGKWVNSSLTGAKTATLSVPITIARNGYKFRCVITDSFNQTVTSNAAILKVTATSLSITTQPKNYTGSVGSTAKFAVTATGAGLKYQWQAYSGGKWVNSSLTGAKTPKLSVPVTYARNGYKFRCVVTDSFNQTVTSKEATLNVTTTPLSITIQPKNYTGSVGSTAKFTVTATGAGLKYQWQAYTNGKWVNSSLPGYNTATLLVPVISSRNGYKFRCVVKDSNNQTVISDEATLHVTTPVVISTQPKDYTGSVGSTAEFKVTAQGPGLKYQWQTYSGGKWVNSSLTGCKTATLSVPVTKARNGYKFRCVITDSKGNSITSNEVYLKVKT